MTRFRDLLRNSDTWLLATMIAVLIGAIASGERTFVKALGVVLGLGLFAIVLLFMIGLIMTVVQRLQHYPVVWARWLAYLVLGALVLGVLLGWWDGLPATARSLVFLVGIYIFSIGAGLLVLYVAVRIIRAAWGAPNRDAELLQLTRQLTERYKEINLLYNVAEILAQTLQLDAAIQRILHELSSLVQAERATLLVYEKEEEVLRILALRGMSPQDTSPIELEEARAFRILSYDANDRAVTQEGGERAFLSVPVLFASPGARFKPIGSISLTGQQSKTTFTPADRKIAAAIANQIAAVIANARREQETDDLRKEVERLRDRRG